MPRRIKRSPSGVPIDVLVPGDAGGPPSGPAGGDLGGAYPDPTCIAGQFAGVRLSWATVADGELLRRSGSSVTGVPLPAALPPSGPAGGDLAGTYPAPTCVAGDFSGTRLTWAAVADGELLGRSGTAVVGVPAVFLPSGPAGGDLGGSYPNPTCIAGQFGATRLSWAAVGDGELLARSGSTVAGLRPFFRSAENDATFSTTSTTPVVALALSVTGAPSGTYRISWYGEFSSDSVGASVEILAQLDGGQLGARRFGFEVDVTDNMEASGWAIRTLSGSHTVEILIFTGAGTAKIRRRRLAVERVLGGL